MEFPGDPSAILRGSKHRLGLLTLVTLCFVMLPPTSGAESPPSDVFPEIWMRELLQHPLLCTVFAPKQNGAIMYETFQFEEMGKALAPAQCKQFSNILSDPNNYRFEDTGTEKPPLSPDVLIRFENEQQFIDLIICTQTGTVIWFADGGVSHESKATRFKFTSTAMTHIKLILKSY